jgi:parallel beta-helix repeat protein
MKHNIITSVLVFLLILPTASTMLVASSPLGLKSINISPIRKNTIAQYQTHEPILIASDADFVLQGASGVGTPSDPYAFENFQISDAESCIVIQDTTAYFVIANCIFEADASRPAIILQDVENGRVEQCEIISGVSGLRLLRAVDCVVIENSFYGCWNGIVLNYASNCTILNNRVYNNNNRGVLVEGSDHCDIFNNSIYSNLEYGIEIVSYSNNNSIFGNSIGWNNASGSVGGNVIDNGEDNLFDDGFSIGNLWSDYNGSETYQIPGTGGSFDGFPHLLIDTLNPGIVPLYDIAIDIEMQGNTLTWQVYDQFPKSYEILENEVETISTIWNGDDITINLDHLALGTYAITITLYDGAGNTATDGVFVSVVSFILGGIGTELVMIASGITVVSFVIITLLVKKHS